MPRTGFRCLRRLLCETIKSVIEFPKSPQLDPMLSQLNDLYAFMTFFFEEESSRLSNLHRVDNFLISKDSTSLAFRPFGNRSLGRPTKRSYQI
jgi:hypothetical protein